MRLLKEIWMCISPRWDGRDKELSLKTRLWRNIKLLQELFLSKTGKLRSPICETGLQDPLNQLKENGLSKSIDECYSAPTIRIINGKAEEDIV